MPKKGSKKGAAEDDRPLVLHQRAKAESEIAKRKEEMLTMFFKVSLYLRLLSFDLQTLVVLYKFNTNVLMSVILVLLIKTRINCRRRRRTLLSIGTN